MAVTKESIEKRITDLKAQQVQLVAHANAVAGALQAYESVLGEFEDRDLPIIDVKD